MVATSKKFIDPKKYHFTIGVSWSSNEGQSWTEASLPKAPVWNNQSWDGMTDPAVVFSPNGDVHLLTEPIFFGTVPTASIWRGVVSVSLRRSRAADGADRVSGDYALAAKKLGL
jgi:hypothetical protein